MKTTALLLLLLAGTAVAQSVVTRGNGLKRQDYQTYGTVTLYVDPTGSDANPCTASGTAACATINGALAKLPRFLRSNVVVNLAAGTYTGATVEGFSMSNGVSLTLQGAAFKTWTPASGSATGTLTGYSAGTYPGYPAVTDSTQSWPALWSAGDYLGVRGHFFTITGGTGAGQTRLIAQSTVTAMNLVAAFTTAPTAGSTYAIQEPSSIISDTAAPLTIGTVTGIVNLNDLKVTSANDVSLIKTATGTVAWTTGLRININRTLVESAYAAGTSTAVLINLPLAGLQVAPTDLSVINGDNGNWSLATGYQSVLSMSRSFMRAQRAHIYASTGLRALIANTDLNSHNITASSSMVFAGDNTYVSTSRLICTARPETGAYYGGFTAVSVSSTLPTKFVSAGGFNMVVDGCGTGVAVNGGARFTMGGGTLWATNINSANYLTHGGVATVDGNSEVNLSAAALSYTNINDGGVDYYVGSTALTDAFLSTLPTGNQVYQSPVGGTLFRR